MPFGKAVFTQRQCIMRTDGDVCESTKELLASELFEKVARKYVWHLQEHKSMLLGIFDEKEIDEVTITSLIQTLRMLGGLPAHQVVILYPDSEVFFGNRELFNDFVEGLYNYWRGFDRYLICYSENEGGQKLDNRPYRVFNHTSEQLAHLIRAIYRDIQENITGRRCRIYRQVRAGSQVGLIAVNKKWVGPDDPYKVLQPIPVIRQMLLNPPLIIDPPMNKRTGQFKRVETNPIKEWNINADEWLCYPARVGPLLIYIYFHQMYMELGCSLANLFDLADDVDLKKRPDAIYAFGVPEEVLSRFGDLPTVFYDDEENDILFAAVPAKREFGYFGYLKKMTLTLHNIVMMKRGQMPYHGAMVHVYLKDGGEATVLLIGDSGAGKSETLEAFRILGDEYIRDMIIIADDMGSLSISPEGRLLGYGTETGAFVRLDDLQQGYAFGQIDRAIIMSPQKVNARSVLPITTLAHVLRGYSIDFIFYANNYEEVDEEHPVIERFDSAAEALRVFREGTVMAKGTTTSTGIVHTYFANIFGPPQYKELHDSLASMYMNAAFDSSIFVGQIRTRLGIAGWETKGPEEGAKALHDLISQKK